jgi:hypothetical protein
LRRYLESPIRCCPGTAAVLCAGLLLLSQACVLPALAQSSTSATIGGGDAFQPPPPPRPPPGRAPTTRPQQAPRAPTEAWPRLDPGAMLCRSEDALKAYQEAVATASADAPAALPADCSRVLQRMPISIVQRDGPSRVEVKSSSGTGWTDAWLPATPPSP